MRVADTVLSSTVTNNLRQSLSRINRFQNDLSTGVKIHDASDNPAGASRSLLLRSDIRNNQQFQRNIGEALGQMDFVDSTLDSLLNTVIDLQGVAIAGASDTVNPENRKIMAREVNELLETMCK